MKLTKNEKKVLKLLLENSRISDIEIASKLNISSQAVGKIRKKLEATIIDSYTLNLDCCMLDIRIFAIAIAQLTKEGLGKGESEIEKILLKIPHIINVYRITRGTSSYIILYGFRDMNELDDFFRSSEMRQELHDFIETQELFTFSHKSVVKNSSVQLFNKAMDDMGSRVSRLEFENFKRRLNTR
ncbi:MAG: Lrp/AsnC family transcriptional regulator [Candidatus Aenigmarchaeota archaeon]|nr:Lrp/AsnC family transcriptional regulator [Candidatus Aenigmarchaeota archaeon]